MNEQFGQLTFYLRHISKWLGIALLIISAFMSYDGFDGSVSGGNEAYTIFGIIIGIVLAVTVSTLQFIFSTDIKGLNKTLKLAGLFSYVYSIYTNRLGAVHLLGMDNTISWIVAVFCDVVAEPMIAWGIGEALIGDLIGNLFKTAIPTPPPAREPRHMNADAYNRLPKNAQTNSSLNSNQNFRRN